LEKIRNELIKREADLLIVEDLGRLVRGGEAVNLFGLAVDNGTRAISANDNVDTINASWEADALAACHDHVAHNAHTSSRIKQKKMNRFKKFGASIAVPIFGYLVPENAKTYDDWQRVDVATPGTVPTNSYFGCCSLCAVVHSGGPHCNQC
jgi:site-specific DNA recombinase